MNLTFLFFRFFCFHSGNLIVGNILSNTGRGSGRGRGRGRGRGDSHRLSQQSGEGRGEGRGRGRGNNDENSFYSKQYVPRGMYFHFVILHNKYFKFISYFVMEFHNVFDID